MYEHCVHGTQYMYGMHHVQLCTMYMVYNVRLVCYMHGMHCAHGMH